MKGKPYGLPLLPAPLGNAKARFRISLAILGR